MMLLFIYLHVLAFVASGFCQNQFTNPSPRQEGGPAVSWHLGSVEKVTWLTTYPKFRVFCRSEAMDGKGNSLEALQLFDPSVDNSTPSSSSLLLLKLLLIIASA